MEMTRPGPVQTIQESRVPLLVYSPSLKEGGKLPETDTFGVIGATVADNFEVKMPEGTIGTSILEQFK